jgi:hypothetical protein
LPFCLYNLFMQLKKFFSLLLVVFIILLASLAVPSVALADNKCGVNLSTYYTEIAQVQGLVKSGGWVVGIGNIMDGISLQSFFGHDLNVVIRGHAGWAFPLQTDPQWLDNYALSWVATMATMNTGQQPIFFMPLNEPNQTGSTDYLPESAVQSYLTSLQKYLNEFQPLIQGEKIILLSPMLNQTHGNYSTYLSNLRGYSFYHQYDFQGASQNLYDFRDGCTSSGVFCHPDPKKNARDYNQFGISGTDHYAVEAGVFPAGVERPTYEDQPIADLINTALNDSWSKGEFKMFSIFSHDPHSGPSWDIFNAPLTKQAYSQNCQTGTTYTKSFNTPSTEEVKAQFPQLQTCDNGALVTSADLCVAAGSGNPAYQAFPYSASRFVKANSQVAESLTDPVQLRQSDSLPQFTASKEGRWGANFEQFDELTIPWAKVVTKYLAGPFVYDGNTAIRDLLDSSDLVQFRPLADLTPKSVQDEFRTQYWEACGIDDPCNEMLHCNTKVIDKECCESYDDKGQCKESYIPCVGPESNECLLSNGQEIRQSVLTLPPKLEDPAYENNDALWLTAYKSWESQYGQWWKEIPFYSNPLSRVKGGIRMETCDGKRSGTGVTTYTPWVSALDNVSEFLNTMLSPSENTGTSRRWQGPTYPVELPDQPIEIGDGSWYQDSGQDTPDDTSDDTYCSAGEETTKILSQSTEKCFNYQATIKMADNAYGGGILFRSYADGSFYNGYGFHIKDRGDGFEWTLKKTQTEQHCKKDCPSGTGRCYCANNLWYDSEQNLLGGSCDCSNLNDLNTINNPMNLKALQDYESAIVLDKSQPHELEVSVCDQDSGSVKIEARLDDIVTSYEDKLMPFTYNDPAVSWRGLGISVYNGDRTEMRDQDLATCFTDIFTSPYHQLAALLEQQKTNFWATAGELVYQDWNSFKKKVTTVKNNLTKPVALAKKTWKNNSDLPRYQKIEKVLLASRELFVPSQNLLAYSMTCFSITPGSISFTPTGQDGGDFYVNIAINTDKDTGCDGHIQFFVDTTQTLFNQQWYKNADNPFNVDPDHTESPFHVNIGESVNHTYRASIDECGGNCGTKELSISCTFEVSTNANGEAVGTSNCGAVSPQPPVPLPPAAGSCQAPGEPEYKPDGPEDPVIVEGHTIFEIGQYNLYCENANGTSAWETDQFGVTKCDPDEGGRRKTEDSYEAPVWAIVKYPYLNKIYEDLSELENGLFAKFLPLASSEVETKDWDIAGESQISYCTVNMADLAGAHPEDPTWAPFCESFPNNVGLYPYSGRNPIGQSSLPNNAICSGRTEGLKAYPKYIGGVANGWEWLVCTLNPAGADCASLYEQGLLPTPTPSSSDCQPLSHYCPNTNMVLNDPSNSVDTNGLADTVLNSWPESRINFTIDQSFIDLAAGEWQEAIDDLGSGPDPLSCPDINNPDCQLWENLTNFYQKIPSFLGKTWLDFVLTAAEDHGWSPKMVTSLWIEESGASAYGHWKDANGQEVLIEDLGCGAIKKNLPGNLTCLFTAFESFRQSGDTEDFLLMYKSYDWYKAGCFQYPADQPITETFPGRVCYWYDKL